MTISFQTDFVHNARDSGKAPAGDTQAHIWNDLWPQARL